MPIAASKADASAAIHVAHAQESAKRVRAGRDFPTALTHAQAATSDPTARPETTHVVKTGDTLYGIAQARLAAIGARSDPGASMRHALQIAQSNGIRDPNRIQPGQTLDLARTAAPGSARPAVPGTSPDSLATAAMAAPGRRPAWETRILEDVHRDPTDELAFDLPEILAMPATVDAEIVGGAAPGAAPSDTASRRAISRYQEAAATTPPPAPAIRSTDSSPETSGQMPDIVYKGLVGKALDALPMDASARTGLQQANAVIGSSFAGRTLAALTGIGGPFLTLAGLAWGLFSAQKIAAAQPAETASAGPHRAELTAARE